MSNQINTTHNTHKYLVCINITDSHDGALRYINTILQNKNNVEIELLIVVQEDVGGGLFGASFQNSCGSEIIDEKQAYEKLEEAKQFLINAKFIHTITKTLCRGEISDELKKKTLNENNIAAIIFGASLNSIKHKTVTTIIEKIGNIITIPMIVIPQNITNDQIHALI